MSSSSESELNRSLRSASRVRPRILSLTDASTAASPHIIRRLRLATLASCISI